ncbi:MAG: class I SAM-dependent methyltransferase [Dehalococcoidia bacterium]
MPEEDGLALYRAGLEAAATGPLLEIGSYCGKSAIYLGAAAREAGTVLFSIDHHRGSEEQQPGWEYHDPRLVDPETGHMDTLPWFRRAIASAGLEDVVIAVVGRSEAIAALWGTPLGLVFFDGSHTEDLAQADYEGWGPHVAQGGLLLIHDVFPDPAEGGQAPYHVYRRALASGAFAEVRAVSSLRVLRRVAAGL